MIKKNEHEQKIFKFVKLLTLIGVVLALIALGLGIVAVHVLKMALAGG